MNETPVIVFRLSGQVYGVRASCVREIIWLPELTALTEVPEYIAGVFNYRGRVIPVMDLNLVMGYAPERAYNLADRLIVLTRDNALLGLLVHELDNVRDFEGSRIDPPDFGETSARTRFLEGLVRDDDRIIALLNDAALFDSADLIRRAALNEAAPGTELELPEDRAHRALPAFLRELSDSDRAVFQKRARQILSAEETYDASGHIALGIVQINGEYFGVELGDVMEFAEIRQVTPIPCCPPHIVGCMNLRGNILTLVDIRSVLGMSAGGGMKASKVMVLSEGDLNMGAIIEDIYDVVYVRESEITEVPAALKTATREFLRGAFPYMERVSGIINIKKIIAEGDLVVDLKQI